MFACGRCARLVNVFVCLCACGCLFVCVACVGVLTCLSVRVLA